MRDEPAERDGPGVEEVWQLQGEAEYGLVVGRLARVAMRAGDVCEDGTVEREGGNATIECYVSNSFRELYTWSFGEVLSGEDGQVGESGFLLVRLGPFVLESRRQELEELVCILLLVERPLPSAVQEGSE